MNDLAAALLLTVLGLAATADVAAAARPPAVVEVADGDAIVAVAGGPFRHEVVVFTDLDCPFCQVLHRRIDAYAQLGIRIAYLFYPRSGPGSASFEQAVAVWCAPDRLAALQRAFGDERLPPARCRHPIGRQYRLARSLGLLGTPALVTRDGTVLYGAPPPAALLEVLDGLR